MLGDEETRTRNTFQMVNYIFAVYFLMAAVFGLVTCLKTQDVWDKILYDSTLFVFVLNAIDALPSTVGMVVRTVGTIVGSVLLSIPALMMLLVYGMCWLQPAGWILTTIYFLAAVLLIRGGRKTVKNRDRELRRIESEMEKAKAAMSDDPYREKRKK